jgi:hypothetical protein
MRSRLSLYLNDLSLEEILFLEEELEHRREKYRKHYAVLSAQTDPPVLRANSEAPVGQLARDLRRYMSECAAVGGGTVIAYSPEVSAMLFHSVENARRACSALLSGLPELNGRAGAVSYGINLKLGLAAGADTLAPGSPRCVRKSVLVKRANQCAWRSSAGTLMLDENSYQEWPEKYDAVRVPAEVDGQSIYRVIPGTAGRDNERYDNDALMKYLNAVRAAGVMLLKYGMRHTEVSDLNSHWGTAVDMIELILEAYDPQTAKNLGYSERIATTDLPDRMESVKRLLSSLGLALMRYEDSPVAAA